MCQGSSWGNEQREGYLKFGESKMHSIRLEETEAQYEMFFQFACGLTLALEESEDRKVGMRMELEQLATWCSSWP